MNQFAVESFVTRLFEFLADHTSVEWSLFKTGSKGSGPNFMVTSHYEDHESGGTDLLHKQLLHGYTLREHIHNHPHNTLEPSGLKEAQSGSYKHDMRFVHEMYNMGYHNLEFYIYTRDHGYARYGVNSTLDEFRDYQGISLDEIVVMPKR